MMYRKAALTLSFLLVTSCITCSLSFSPVSFVSTRKQELTPTCGTTKDDDHHHHHQYKKEPMLSKVVASVFLASLLVTTTPAFAFEGTQGLDLVVQSELGKSVRRSIVGGAQLVDGLDLKWERLSDSLRDQNKCDARTNRRMFDNGTRKDGKRETEFVASVRYMPS
jgi:hypothetical protein